MKDLKQCRIEIDAIDQQLMELFEKRMALSKSVVEYKIENHLEIFQPERERICKMFYSRNDDSF